jgi:flavin reductase (DIM6/NTAB) family NADH-FMN oxidoreductase RutF
MQVDKLMIEIEKVFMIGGKNVDDTNQIQQFKEIMGSYPTGVTVVTTLDPLGNPIGITANSFASVSLDPTLILWSIDRKASTYKVFTKCSHFAVHVLSGDQKDVCWMFAGKDSDPYSKVKWKISENNLPVISEVFGVLQCKCVQRIEAGDHTILVGEVIDLEKNDKEPMLYFRRNVGNIPENWVG